MREGFYGIYNGVEHKIGPKDKSTFTIISHDSNDLNNGFILYKESVYLKNVMANELQSAYSIKTFADYRGYKFECVQMQTDKVLLSIGDYNAYQNLGLDMVDRGIYQKWVDITDLTMIYEEKTMLPGF